MRKAFIGLLLLCLLLVCGNALSDNPVFLMDGTTLETVEIGGLTIPIPSGDGWQSAEVSGYEYYLEKHDGKYMYQYTVNPMKQYSEAYTEDYIRSYYQGIVNSASGPAEMIEAESGYPLAVLCEPNYKETRGQGILGTLVYVRGSKHWIIRYGIYPESLFQPVQELNPEISDLEKLAAAVAYDEANSEVGLTIKIKDEPKRLTAGKSLTFKSEFLDKNYVNANAKNMKIEWSVYGKDGNPVDGITITNTGTLNTSRKLQENTDIIVQVRSVSFKTRAYYQLTVIPMVSEITTDPSEILFWLGTSEPAEVKASIIPECVPTDVLKWVSAGKDIATVEDQGDAKAVITPVKTGKTSINVSEAGGKKATVKITVAQEVTEIGLSFTGKAKAGATVQLKANIEPKNATNKNCTWSTDADENVAAVKANGQLRIGKETPSGTVITVTCTAEGAPEPVVRTMEITVE